jgi:hypothetical protein
MSFFANAVMMGKRVLGGRRKPKRTGPKNGFVPCLEILEDRVVLSSYYWRPNPDLSPADQRKVSEPSNWRIGSWRSAVVATQAPGADDKLYFTPGGNYAVFDGAASGTYAAVSVAPGVGYTLQLERNITFDSSGDGSGSELESYIYGGTIDERPGDRFTMTFSGSPLTLSNGNFVRVTLINSAGNTVTMRSGETDFSTFAKFENSGTVNWGEDGIWEIEESTFDNSGTLNVSTTGNGSIRPGPTFGGTFNNLAAGVINVTGAGTECIIANGVVNDTEIAFTNAGNMNFTDGSTTTFQASQISQSAGDTEFSGNSIVNVGTAGAGTFSVNGGTLGGAGTLNGNLQVAQATIRPGTATVAGILNVDGDITMGAQTQTSIILTANITNSQLAVTGTVALAGTLTVAIPNGVNIDANQSWPIITGTIQGTFAAPPNQPAGFSDPTYNVGSVVVQNPEMQTCGPQATNENTALGFAPANDDAIAIPDPNAGPALLQVTLTALDGLLTLSGTSGLTFSSGTGTGNTTMTFIGAISDINTALNGLIYAPNTNFYGSDLLTIATTDTPASGGSYAASNTVPITVTQTVGVTALSQSTGATGGGYAVTITGFSFSGATAVTFGSVTASFVINSDTSITATVPAQALGTVVDVTVTAPAGVSPTSSADQFTYVNGAPVGTNNTVSTLENQPYTFQQADFGFTDPNNSPAGSFLAVEISSLPTAGTLTDNGALVAIGQYVSISDINAGLLVYTPPTNGYGAALDSFTFQVQNNGGVWNNGVDTDPSPKTMTVNVTQTVEVTGFSFTVWLYSGDTLNSVDYAFTSSAFGGAVYASGTANPTLSAVSSTGTGWDYYTATVSGLNFYVPVGTSWLALQNATTADGYLAYWEENDGASQAVENTVGAIGSESFAVAGVAGNLYNNGPDLGANTQWVWTINSGYAVANSFVVSA